MVQIFGGIAIGIALVFLLLLFKKHVLKSKEEYGREILDTEKDDAFVDIPVEVLAETLLRNNSTSIHELQEKIRKFKSRNRFYKY